MRSRSDNRLITNRELFIELAMVPLRAIGAMMASLAVSNARTQALQEIAAIPEDQLLARGTTRVELIRNTFRHEA
ncbi:MAG: DUF1127 domain-containing protein [Pseudomonadota bacterium]